jgi:pyruvate dehydrogenase E2 component (dihydrolipoamide acetyltransferase)
MSELKEFRLPDTAEGLTEADIITWHVKPGDTVKDGQIIVDIETAKAVVELPSPYSGTVTKLLVEEGQTVDVGAPIIIVDVSGGPLSDAAQEQQPAAAGGPGQSSPAAEQPAAAEKPAEGEGRQAVLVGYGVKTAATTRRARKTESPAAPPSRPVSAPPAALPASRAGGLAKPPVRKLAKDLGISLGELNGTGPAGSITRDDVQQAAQRETDRRSDKGGFDGFASTTDERIPIRGVRKAMAAAMVSSAFTAPHVTEFLQIDITETMAAVRRVRELPEFEGVRVSPLLLVARALLVAVRRHPLINSSWDEAAQEIVVKRPVNLGIAVAAERGLLVPNVKGADALPLAGLARAIDELAATARAGKATPAELAGGTISITNVGVFGVDAGTPILMPGEAAILAFGQVRDLPWVVSGELAVRKVTTLSLSFDHRIVDGELGSAVLRDVGSMLEDPMRMVAWS